MFMKNNIYQQVDNITKKSLASKKIAIIQARFNSKITDSLVASAVQALSESGVLKKNIEIVKVPGSFEIPLACQRLALKKKYSGLVAVGAVIKGETAHFEYISQAVSDGILRVSLDYNLPIGFGVITTYNLAQAEKRSQNNQQNKGREAALALVEMISNV
jgi:6,7-dimethyl-8-ribityllumazine synthase